MNKEEREDVKWALPYIKYAIETLFPYGESVRKNAALYKWKKLKERVDNEERKYNQEISESE